MIKEGDLIAATHGRSFYVMDDLSALRQMTPQTAAAPAHLYAPREAYPRELGRWVRGVRGARAARTRRAARACTTRSRSRTRR